MHVLWHSDAPWVGSSVGQQTQVFVPRLVDAGLDVTISAMNGLLYGPHSWDGVPVFPGDPGDILGIEALQRNVRLVRPDLVVILTTPWAEGFRGYEPTGVPMASFCPSEHDPLPARSVTHFERTGAVPFAVTHDGERLLSEAGLAPLYVPHGIDTSLFRPGDRADARRALDLPEDAFVVGMVASNKADNRKSWPEAFAAFAAFHDHHPDALFLAHTFDSGGVALGPLAHDLGFPDAVRTPSRDAYLAGLVSQADMARMYPALDVLLAPSRGEGFGLPLIEAQACGVPVIVTDFGSMPEVGAVGWKVSGQPEYLPSLRAWYMAPNIDEITAALEAAYEDAGSLREAARAHAVQYDADLVTEQHLVPALRAVAHSATELPAAGSSHRG